jgi:hypothetical protein
MPDRVFTGVVPMAVLAALLTGCGQAESMSPPDDGRAVGILSQFTQEPSEAGKRKKLPEAAVTPGQVTEVFNGVDASLEAEIKRRAPLEKESKERLRRERLRQKGADWAPSGGGWGN